MDPERLAQEEQSRLRFFAEALARCSQPFIACGLDGGISAVNDAFCALSGYGQDELHSLNWLSDLTPPDWHELEAAALVSLNASGEPQRYEKQCWRKDGSLVPVEVLAHLYRDEEGRPSCYYSFVTDLSERKGAEAFAERAQADRERLLGELRQQRDFLNTVTENLVSFVAVFSGQDLRLKWHNPSFARIMGPKWQGQDLSGRTVQELVPGAEASGSLARMRAVSQEGRRFSEPEYEFHDSSGAARYLRYTLLPLPTAEGAEADVMLVGLEVTEQVQAGQKRQRSYERLQALVRVSEEIMAADCAEAALQRALDGARELTGARLGAASYMSAEASRAVVVSSCAPGAQPCTPECCLRSTEAIYHHLLQERPVVRISEAEMEGLPECCGPSPASPLLRGLLAARLAGSAQEGMGLLMLTDKEDGSDFDAEDEALLLQLATVASLGLQHIAAKTAADRHADEVDAILDSLASGLVVYDVQGHILHLNRPADAMFGFSREDWRLSPGERVAKINWRKLDGQLYQADELPAVRAARGEVVRSEVGSLGTPGQGERWISVSAAPVRSRTGEITAVVSSFVDVTELRRAQLALEQAYASLEAQSEELQAQAEELQAQNDELARLTGSLAAERERLAVTLRSIGDGVIATDLAGRVVLMNPVAQQLTGWSEDEAIGRPLREVFNIIKEGSGEPQVDPVAEVLATGKVVALANHTALVSRQGERYIIEDSAAPIRGHDGAIGGVVLVFHDVTIQRKLEEELAKANKLESLGVLAGGIAHDFNNLLTAILGNIDLARLDAPPGSEQQELLADAELASNRAKGLAQQLLTFAKGGAPIRRLASLGELVRQTTRFALSGSRSRYRINIAPDLWPVEIDTGQMAQVIQNLVINADEAMPGGGLITISAENVSVTEADALPLPPGPYVRLAVTDEGIGIPSELVNRIFDPYFTTKDMGHGIGLAVCYSVVSKHDGHIAVKSRPGAGSTFYVYLPAAGAPAERRQVSAQPAAVSRERVLVMDDEEVVTRTLKRMLTKLGYDVEVTADGAQAVERYRLAAEQGRPFMAVILDLVVPGGMGGLETLERLRQLDAGVRAIVSSGYSTHPVMSEFLKHGFLAMIEKPYHLEELRTALETAKVGQG